MLMTPDASFRAEVDGIELTGEPFRHEPGYYVRGVEGLVLGGSTTYSQVTSESDGSDGEADLPNRRADPRIITLSGFAYARSMRDLGVAMDGLAAVLSESEDADWFSWQEFGERRRAWVRRGRDGTPRRLGSTGRMDFIIRFRAPSQRYFGTQHPKVGPAPSITLENRGSLHDLPVLEVTGTMPAGYRIIADTGDVYTVTAPLAAGQVHRIDMTDRVLHRNGTPDPGGGFGVIRVPKLARTVTLTIGTTSGAGQLSGWSQDCYV